jgi:anaerobic ribonucleoside-triphosphate reductase activating protein
MECSLVNGPGRRTVVWFQGCQLACRNCWNKETHPQFGGVPIYPSDLIARIMQTRRQYQVEGVTFSGGEPIHQIEGVTECLSMLKRATPELSVGLFSGYTERELDHGHFEIYSGSDRSSRRDLWMDLRQYLDFAVLGRFNRDQPCSDPLVSSRNQLLRLFSDRYNQQDFEDQAMEVSIEADGFTQITGFPTLGVVG